MNRLLSVIPLFAFMLVACPTDGIEPCDSYIYEYTCINGTCSCDDDVAACIDPDDTTEDDPENCENLCQECAPLSQ